MRRLNIALVGLLLVSALLAVVPVQAASAFADPSFQMTWQAAESGTPNFWGPLSTSRDGQQESYKEAPGGKRLVQYFDKARMELTTPALPSVTTGLLTVELKTGAMQTGDGTFEQRQPSIVGLVGDPGSPGPTYADLSQLPEKDARTDTPPPFAYSNGKITGASNLPSRANTIPRLYYKLNDPSGRYSQFVFYPFWDFIKSLPLPLSQTTGYAISPLIWVHATVGGKPTEVLVQAFERRILTWNESNPPGKEVEFGNIGQHYYQWRYGATPVSAPPPSSLSPTLVSNPFDYCAQVVTADPGDRHKGQVQYSGPEDYNQPFPNKPGYYLVAWRCSGGKVLGCHDPEFGTRAGAITCGKIDMSATPPALAVESCAAGSDFVSDAGQGNSAYDWTCKDGKPVIQDQLIHPDQLDDRGYRKANWYVIVAQ